MAVTDLHNNDYPPSQWTTVSKGARNVNNQNEKSSFVHKSTFDAFSNDSEPDLNDPDEFPTVDSVFKFKRHKSRMPRITRKPALAKQKRTFSDEDNFDFDAYMSEENLEYDKNMLNKLQNIKNVQFNDHMRSEPTYEGYVYEEDETIDGPNSQWELLKYTRIDNYESQTAKAERLRIEAIVSENEARVAREAQERRVTISDVVSDYESDADNEDAAWCDELLEENGVSSPPELEASDSEEEKPFVGMSPDISFNSSRLRKESGEVAAPPLMSQAEAKLREECSPGGSCGCSMRPPRRSARRRSLNLTANYAGRLIPEEEEEPTEIAGHLCPLTFKEQATLARDQCRAERAEAESVMPTMITPQDRPINEMKSEAKTYEEGWQKISMAVDSGAAETVIPHTLVTAHPIRETDASRRGVNYASATGQPIPNLGEQRLPLCTVEGTLRSMTFQATPVARPLGSVKRMMESGHRVVFDPEGCFIENKSSGEINWLREENGNFMMDMWIMPVDKMNEMIQAGFGRPS